MKKIIIIIVLALAPVIIYAQPLPPAYGQNGNQQPGGGAPIDGGLSILLLMGAAYGAKKVYNLNHTSKTDNKIN